MATKVEGLQLLAQLLVLAPVLCRLQAQQHLVFILAQVVLLAASQVVHLLQMLQCHQVALQGGILLSVEVLPDQDQCIPQDLQDGQEDLNSPEDNLVQEVLPDQVLPLDLLGQAKEVHLVLSLALGRLQEDQGLV